MKKIIGLSLMLLSAAIFVPSIEAKSNNSAATINASAPQIVIRTPNRRYQRRTRVVTQTRNVRRGRNLYRETYRTTYFANGRTTTRLVSRVLVRRY